MNTKVKIAITAVVCLAVGYFGGREYLKYQIRSTMRDAFTQMQSNLSGAATDTQNVAPPPGSAASPPAEAQPRTVAMTKNGFSPEDIQNGVFEADITFTLQFKNETGKDIRAFDGLVVFKDLLGNRILASRVEINERVAKGQTLDWPGAIEYNQFEDSHQRLRSEPKENLKVSFLASKVLFADGTTEGY